MNDVFGTCITHNVRMMMFFFYDRVIDDDEIWSFIYTEPKF